MKARYLLALGAALAAFTLNVNAADNFLSPRDAGNATRHVAGTNATAPTVATPSVAPRVAGNKAVTVAGTKTQATPAMECARHMTANPKVIQACAANPGNMPCCATASK